ncbi:SLC13 family permease [Mycetocola spongiae]|uniref:SLC13 family permease n=1 Tax=Mycetocola spongiae TaxID=2859226 RepID=UPI001CF13C83|nr:SLC13 family permease [Mycetocola spongiae]UCR90219.1 SLC13 family permease [Mycetocola spongiae]
MDPILATFLILGAAVIAFLSGRLPLAVIAVGVSLALWASGVLPLQDALAGFGDPTVLFIAALFIVSEGLDSSGVTALLGRAIAARSRGNSRRALLLIMLIVAALTALISVNGAVAALLPMTVIIAVRSGFPPARLLLPLAFAAHAGSLLALTGSPVNVIVSEIAREETGHGFGFLEFGLVGVPLVVGTVLIVMLCGRGLVPERAASALPRDLSGHADTLFRHYSSPVSSLLPDPALETVGGEEGVAEVIVAPRSSLIGERAFPGMVSASGALIVLAIQRNGKDTGSRETILAGGDALLVRGPWAALEALTASDRVLAVDEPALWRRQILPLGPAGYTAIAVLLGMIILLVSGAVPAAVAGLLGAGAMILTRVVSMGQAYRSISWTTVILVAGMIPLSTAFLETGAAEVIGHGLILAVGAAGPHMILLAMCLVVAILGQLISNTATVLIMAPIAIAIAGEMNLSLLPFLMALAVTGAAAFLTPVATPVNMMVMGPGGYRFSDYWRLGLPLLALFLAVAVLLVPLIWPF